MPPCQEKEPWVPHVEAARQACDQSPLPLSDRSLFRSDAPRRAGFSRGLPRSLRWPSGRRPPRSARPSCREHKRRETADRQGDDPGQEAVASVASCQRSCGGEGDENRPTRERRAVELNMCSGTAVLPTSCACGIWLPIRGVHCREASGSWARGPGSSRSRAQECGSRWSRPQRGRSGRHHTTRSQCSTRR